MDPMEQFHSLTDGQLAQMPWDDLIRLRKQLNDHPLVQERLAPFEHRAYAREQVAANPLMAPIYGLMAPGYQALKIGASGMGLSRTGPSLEQLQQSLYGVGEGLTQGIRGLTGL